MVVKWAQQSDINGNMPAAIVALTLDIPGQQTTDKVIRSILARELERASADTWMRAPPPSPRVAMVPAELLADACNIALAISGHFSENPDEWLRAHEKRLRELEKIARRAAPPHGAANKPCPRCGVNEGDLCGDYNHAEQRCNNMPQILATEQGLTPTGKYIAECERDAARYRWLRIHSTQPAEGWSTHSNPESLDTAVDEAMAARALKS